MATRAAERPYDPDLPIARAQLAAELVRRLEAAGFALEPGWGPNREQVYRRAVTRKQDGQRVETGAVVRVFTTIVSAGHALEVRALGKDAIRICGVFDKLGKPPRPLMSEARVFRTGTVEGIAGRMIERMRSVWDMVLKRERCRDCGAPTFTSTKGNTVCAAVCFADRKS